VHKETVIESASVDVNRPDVATAFPEIPGAEQSGFRTTVTIPDIGENELLVRAILQDESRVLLGTIRAWRHESREERYSNGSVQGKSGPLGGFFRQFFGREVVKRARVHEWRRVLRGVRTLLRCYPPWQRLGRPPVPGRVRFGGLRRLTPISRNFGWERGGPIDRYYVEGFLARHSEHIRGRVLEIQDASYTRRFGGERVSTSDVLDVAEDNRQATIHADLTRADYVPSEAFDCIILTQTLHVIYDVHSVTQTLYRILKPGGVLLATFPGISQVDWTDQWYWSLTSRTARGLFEEVFPEGSVVVETHGNVLVATAFLHGLGVAELREEELDFRDPDYQFLIAIKAVKPRGHNGGSLSPRKNQDG
jgi:Methyltransferase domain